MPPVTVLRADLDDPAHAAAIVDGIDAYARDPMGGGRPLRGEVRATLVDGLRATPMSMVWLARDGDGVGDAYVGVVVAFAGYSTFAAKPRWNIHDLGVKSEARGRGVGRLLLQTVIDEATAAGATAVSLEVRRDNPVARGLYVSMGFGGGDDPLSSMDFWVRPTG